MQLRQFWFVFEKDMNTKVVHHKLTGMLFSKYQSCSGMITFTLNAHKGDKTFSLHLFRENNVEHGGRLGACTTVLAIADSFFGAKNF